MGAPPSILKNFKIITRKPVIGITAIKGKDNRTIVNTDGVGEIDKHSQEILHGRNLITGDVDSVNYITDGNIKYYIITYNGTNDKITSPNKMGNASPTDYGIPLRV